MGHAIPLMTRASEPGLEGEYPICERFIYMKIAAVYIEDFDLNREIYRQAPAFLRKASNSAHL